MKGHRLLQVVIISLPFEQLIIPKLPLNVPVYLIFVFGAALIITIKGGKFLQVGVERLLLLFTFIALISIIYALASTPEATFQIFPDSYGIHGSKYRGLYQIAIMLAMYLPAWIIVNSCKTMSGLLSILRLWLWLAIAINGFGYYEVLAHRFGLPIVYPTLGDTSWTRPEYLGVQRAYSIFGEPTRYACFLLMNIFLTLALRLYWSDGARTARLPVGTALITSCVALYFTASAAGFAVFGLLIAAMMLWAPKHSLRGWQRIGIPLVLGAGFAAVVFCTGLWGKLYQEKFSVAGKFGNEYVQEAPPDARIQGMTLGLEAFQEHPFIGVGFGNEPFYTYMPEVSELSFGTYNLVVSRLTEVGIIGTVCFVILIWRMFFPHSPLHKERLIMPRNMGLVVALRWGLVGTMVYRLCFGPSLLLATDWMCVGLISVAMLVGQLNDRSVGLKRFCSTGQTPDTYARM